MTMTRATGILDPTSVLVPKIVYPDSQWQLPFSCYRLFAWFENRSPPIGAHRLLPLPHLRPAIGVLDRAVRHRVPYILIPVVALLSAVQALTSLFPSSTADRFFRAHGPVFSRRHLRSSWPWSISSSTSTPNSACPIADRVPDPDRAVLYSPALASPAAYIRPTHTVDSTCSNVAAAGAFAVLDSTPSCLSFPTPTFLMLPRSLSRVFTCAATR
jgi:hypothetical protein